MAALLIAYGGFIGLGGIVAYLREKRTPPLVVGAFVGAVLILCGILAWTEFRFGAYLGLVVTLLMTLLFAARYRRTKKVRPAGFMTVISLIVLVATGYLLFV